MRRYYEVIACGYDGNTDETDDRVIWVEAKQLDLIELLLDVPHDCVYPLEHSESDYRLPRDNDLLVEKLKHFAENLP